MDILLLNTKDEGGGAVQATLRLHKGLLNAGINSRVLVQEKQTTDNSILGPAKTLSRFAQYRSLLDSIPLRRYMNREEKTFSPAWLPDKLNSRIEKQNPDILHLNWITGGFLQIETIGSFERPIVWTMHDMWPFTGGCHFSYSCDKFTDQCGSCPILKSGKSDDLSRKVWERKQDSWEDLDIVLVAPSSWLANCAQKSALFSDERIEQIPYGLDLRKYDSISQTQGRKLFDLPEEAKIVLFGANSTSPRKGFDYLLDGLNTLKKQSNLSNIELAIFGPYNDSFDFQFPTHKLGYLDQTRLRLAYAASDVLVVPSLQDNLPNVVLESMACGTPCVAFDIGGFSDMIDHEESGYLADPFSSDDLANGIEFVLGSDPQKLSERSKQKVASEFDIKDTVEEYKKIYQGLL